MILEVAEPTTVGPAPAASVAEPSSVTAPKPLGVTPAVPPPAPPSIASSAASNALGPNM